MAYDMVLKWRRGTEHVAPGALSPLRRRSIESPDETQPGDVVADEEELQTGATGPVLDGVPLQKLAPRLYDTAPQEVSTSGDATPEFGSVGGAAQR